MRLEDYFDFLDADTIRLKGHRLGIEDVLDLYLEGYSPEQIALEFPDLNLELIHATITYYWHDQDKIETYLTRLDNIVAESIRQESQKDASAVVKRIHASQQMQPAL
ncbi:MAG: DUF433 domain-containing protein [Anaerolineae bacterium]|nr:DUF433 domain-containing protein [Anaerolineae bacterium]